MNSQTPRARFSSEERKRAVSIYRSTKWIALAGLIALSFGLTLLIEVSFPNLPDWIRKAAFPSFLPLAILAGEELAAWRLRQMGLQRLLRENRTWVGRAKLGIAQDTLQLSDFVKYACLLAVFSLWALIFFVLQLNFFASQSPEDRKDCTIATTFITFAICIVTNYLFPNSLFKRVAGQFLFDEWGTNYPNSLKNVPWSQVAKVREERVWKINGKLVEYRLFFLDQNNSTLKRAVVNPEHSDNVIQEIKKYLDNPRLEIETQNRPLA